MTTIFSDFLIGSILIFSPLLMGILFFHILFRKLRIRIRDEDTE